MATLTTPDDAEVCASCAVELQDGSRDADEVWRGEGDCAICNQQCCNWHGHDYNGRWEHESCHEAIDYSHDGSY